MTVEGQFGADVGGEGCVWEVINQERSRLHAPGQSPRERYHPCIHALEGRCHNMNLGPVSIKVTLKPYPKVRGGPEIRGFGRSELCSQRHLQGQEELTHWSADGNVPVRQRWVTTSSSPAKGRLQPRSHLPFVQGPHPKGSGEQGPEAIMGPWLSLQEWRLENPGTGLETGGQLPILHTMPSAWQGTERPGPAAHLQGVLGWHTENLITTGMSAGKVQGPQGTHPAWGSQKLPLGRDSQAESHNAGKVQAKLERVLEGGSDQSLGQEGLRDHTLVPCPELAAIPVSLYLSPAPSQGPWGSP